MSNEYWTHNVAYHNWILKHIKSTDNVLDVGCGDGLLVQKLSNRCQKVIGIEPHLPSATKAAERKCNNASVFNISFENFEADGNTFDAVIFVASIHHMELSTALKKLWLY